MLDIGKFNPSDRKIELPFAQRWELISAYQHPIIQADSSEGMIEFKLEAGEMPVFDNQRLMHGRSAFDPSSGKGQVRSRHVDPDEFYSRPRNLYAERRDPRRWMTFRKD